MAFFALELSHCPLLHLIGHVFLVQMLTCQFHYRLHAIQIPSIFQQSWHLARLYCCRQRDYNAKLLSQQVPNPSSQMFHWDTCITERAQSMCDKCYKSTANRWIPEPGNLLSKQTRGKISTDANTASFVEAALFVKCQAC